MFKRILATIAVAFLMGAGTLALAPPALAAGVPAQALVCDEEAALENQGGWAARAFTSEKAGSASVLPTRPRSFTLGEPCVDAGIDSWLIPLHIEELPLEGFDPDDPANLPASGSEGPCNYHTSPTLAVLATMPVGCDEPVLYVNSVGNSPAPTRTQFIAATMTFGTPTVSNANRSLTWTMTGSYPTTGYGSTGQLIIPFTVICKDNTTGTLSSLNESEQFNAAGAAAADKTFVATCSSGRSVLAAYQAVYSAVGTYDVVYAGIFFRADGVAAIGAPGTLNGYQSSRSIIGDASGVSTVDAGYYRCSATKDGATTDYPVNISLASADGYVQTAFNWPAPLVDESDVVTWAYTDYASFSSGATTTTCKYLHEIRIAFCSITNILVGAGPNYEYACISTQWLYDTWRQHIPYDDGSPGENLCNYGEWDPDECLEVLYPPDLDYSSYEDACPDAPEPAWLDFGWLPSFVGYHAQCLFIPQGGWDPDGVVPYVWSLSSAAEISDVVVGLGETFAYAESCGTIIDGTGTIVPMVIDTCGWDWAAPLKNVLALGASIAFGGWAVYFVVSNIVGILNRKTPNPIESSAD